MIVVSGQLFEISEPGQCMLALDINFLGNFHRRHPTYFEAIYPSGVSGYVRFDVQHTIKDNIRDTVLLFQADMV